MFYLVRSFNGTNQLPFGHEINNQSCFGRKPKNEYINFSVQKHFHKKLYSSHYTRYKITQGSSAKIILHNF